MRRIAPLGIKHNREIVRISEMGAPGIQRGLFNAPGHNCITFGTAFCVDLTMCKNICWADMRMEVRWRIV